LSCGAAVDRGLRRGPFRDLDEASHHVLAYHSTLQKMKYCLRCV
jgi:hypothetical protein